MKRFLLQINGRWYKHTSYMRDEVRHALPLDVVQFATVVYSITERKIYKDRDGDNTPKALDLLLAATNMWEFIPEVPLLLPDPRSTWVRLNQHAVFTKIG